MCRPDNNVQYCPTFSAPTQFWHHSDQKNHFILSKLHWLFIKMHLSFNLWCRSIRCLRNIIHWNLITTFILRNVMWFLLQLIDHNIHESNEVTELIYCVLQILTNSISGKVFLLDVTLSLVYFLQPWCRLITTIYNYFVVTNFFWMFVEGCYLHTAIVMTYSTDKLRKWVFLFIGWCEYIGTTSFGCWLHSYKVHKVGTLTQQFSFWMKTLAMKMFTFP